MFTKHSKSPLKHMPYIFTSIVFTLALFVNIHAINSIVIDDQSTPLANSPIVINGNSNGSQIHPAEYFRRMASIPKTEPLSGPALYNYYVDLITTDIYPDISADYVKAIVWHESRYNPDAVNSRTGVCGLMQISPKWHIDRARSIGVDDLCDPYGNLLVGCDILNEISQRYGFRYALNFFAGGYTYADAYKNSTSPFEKELEIIIEQMNNGDIVVGGGQDAKA